MSVEVLTSRASATPVKRSKSHKRKHEDVSKSPVNLVKESQPSPTKKPKHSNSLQENAVSTATFARLDTNSAIQSPFSTRTLSLYLPVAPIALQTPIPGLCAEHLSPLLLTYFPPLRGVVLSYSNPRLAESPDHSNARDCPTYAVSIAEYGASFVWLTADFLVLAPDAGAPIEGWVNLQSETHIGLVCWNLFSATIPRNRLPEDWKWIPAGGSSEKAKKKKDKLKGDAEVDEDAMDVDESAVVEADDGDAENHGHYVDGQERRVTGLLTFAVVEVDAQAGTDQAASFVSIRGTLLDKEGEAKVVLEEREDWERRHSRRDKGKRKPKPYVMSGARSETVDEAVTNGTGKTKPTEKEAKRSKESKKSKKAKTVR